MATTGGPAGWHSRTIRASMARSPLLPGPATRCGLKKRFLRKKKFSSSSVAAFTGLMKNWPDLKEAEVLIIPSCDYEMSILPMDSVDEVAGLVKTTFPSSRPIGRVKYFDKTIWVENIFEALDQPGEWVFEGAHRKI